MLLLPNLKGCTIISDNGYFTCIGAPSVVVEQLFFNERKLSDSTSLIDPKCKEVQMIMDNQPITEIYCNLLKQFGIHVSSIYEATQEQIFKGGTKWND